MCSLRHAPLDLPSNDAQACSGIQCGVAIGLGLPTLSQIIANFIRIKINIQDFSLFGVFQLLCMDS